MEVDSNCLFMDVGGCGGVKTPCHCFLKPSTTTDGHSSLLGCETKLESLILQYGKINMDPCNVEKFHVCDNHSGLLRSTCFTKCCLCTPLGRGKSSKSGLRTISKLHAIAAWKKYQVRSCFARKMCAQCRNELDKLFKTVNFDKECHSHFQWLYDTNIVHTPSTPSSDSYRVLSQSFNELIVEDKQSRLKEFLQGIKFFDRVPITKSFANLQLQSKRRFSRESTKVLKSILELLAPDDDVDVVWQANAEYTMEKFSNKGNNIKLDTDLRLILNSLTEAYDNANHWTVRRQILSIMAKDISFATIRMFIPDLTVYRYNIARQHADFYGKGAVVDDIRTPTIRYEDSQLEHFIEFIVSPHICMDLPFGEKELRLSTGETLLIPLTIRNLAPQRIIQQYYNYCQEYYGNAFHPLGESTLFSVLNGCTASIRRSLSGLDSVSAEGSTAFDLLTKIIDELSTLGLTAIDVAELKRDLQNSRNYLKTDYKVHISNCSTVADHCSIFALSDVKNKYWRQSCDHNHDDKCDRCELLKVTLIKIHNFIEKNQPDQNMRDRLLHRVQQQIKCIEEWKSHLLRTIHQDQARTHVLSNLDYETAMIHVDWAMKWLPVKYRESTKDHFAKRGLSWHIAYVIRKATSKSLHLADWSFDSETSLRDANDDYGFQHRVFCHVFDQCIQNAKTVTSILRHLFLRLRQTAPDIKYVHLRSDNAGCYHSGEALLSIEQLFKETGIWIKSIDFCDPQSGKGPCDRMAAVIKCSIRRFINEKNNCTNAIEFLMASERTNSVEFHACEIQNPQVEKIEWKGVKKINNIEYLWNYGKDSNSAFSEIRAWQSWKIGPGESYRWCDLEETVEKISPLNIFCSTNVSASWINDSYDKEDENHPNSSQGGGGGSSSSGSSTEEENEYEVDSLSSSKNDLYLFDCLVDGCTARYRRHADLLRHYATGKHKLRLEKISLIDKSKVLYHEALTNSHLRSTPLLSITVVPSTTTSNIPPLRQGWAVKRNKQNTRFNSKQKKFLEDKFLEGVNTGMKWDPAKVASDMEMLQNNGSYVFHHDECLSQTQIKSYFSRLTSNRRSKNKIQHSQPSTDDKLIPSSSMNTMDTDSTKSKLDDTNITNESSDDEYFDDRDLEMYSWRHTFDAARAILDHSSTSSTASSLTSTVSSSQSTSNVSSKKKSTVNTLPKRRSTTDGPPERKSTANAPTKRKSTTSVRPKRISTD